MRFAARVLLSGSCIAAIIVVVGCGGRPKATECDRLAASANISSDEPLQSDRPAGVSGVTLDRLDWKRAVPACREALARNSSPRLQYQLARSLIAAASASGDTAWISTLRSAADGGYGPAQVLMGALTSNGAPGFAKSQPEARKWFQKAIDGGDVDAYYYLAGACMNDLSPPDKDGVRACLSIAADKGSVKAETLLGDISGGSIFSPTQNPAEMRKWYGKAAGQGWAEAEMKLGRITSNLQEQAKLFRRAAEQGNVSAEKYLGEAYENGWGVQRSYADAYKWLALAAPFDSEASMLAYGLTKQHPEAVPAKK